MSIMVHCEQAFSTLVLRVLKHEQSAMTEMTPRRQAVLGLVIRSYVERGLPVGSKTFVDSYGLHVSPATIRNEMAPWRKWAF